MTIQEEMKAMNEDRSQEKAIDRRPTETKATKQQTPQCWIRSIHPGLLGDTYIPQRLRKISVPEVKTPMLLVSLEIKKKPGSDSDFECPLSLFKGHGGRLVAKT